MAHILSHFYNLGKIGFYQNLLVFFIPDIWTKFCWLCVCLALWWKCAKTSKSLRAGAVYTRAGWAGGVASKVWLERLPTGVNTWIFTQCTRRFPMMIRCCFHQNIRIEKLGRKSLTSHYWPMFWLDQTCVAMCLPLALPIVANYSFDRDDLCIWHSISM